MADETKLLDPSVLSVCVSITTFASQYGGVPVLTDKSRIFIERNWHKFVNEIEQEVCCRTFMFY